MGRLNDGASHLDICAQYIVGPYDLYDNSHGTADDFIKTRLSLIEIIFRNVEALHTDNPRTASGLLYHLSLPKGAARGFIQDAISELNARFKEARLGLHYHKGLVQFSEDEQTEKRNTEPCWTLLGDAKWENVERELKEAFDRADNGVDDAAFYAAKALESTIKVVCETRGKITGKERGAANFIDQLVSEKNGRFLLPWEGEMIKSFFVHVRNPQGHGAGSQTPVIFTTHQTAWAIETAMSWIKSIIRRT